MIEGFKEAEVFPHRVNFSKRAFEFINLSREKIVSQTFLDERTLGGFLLPQPVFFEEVISFLEDNVSAFPLPEKFIFHTGFCGSTLMARALDRPGKVLCLREPNIFLNLSNYKRQPSFARDQSLPLQILLKGTLQLLNRPFLEGETALIKLSNASTNLAADIFKLNQNSRGILLFQDQYSFLLSLLKKGPPARFFARKLFMTLGLDGNNRETAFYKNPSRYTDLQIFALLWIVQMREFFKLMENFPDRFLLVKMKKFTDKPEKTLQAVSNFLDIPKQEAEIKRVVESDLFKTHSKFQDKKFSPGLMALENKKVERENAHALEFILEWTKPFLSTAGIQEIKTSI